ncbi:hypothetical protein BFU36_11685 [Sulfolobus sp. A20]|nr:hypothetical protein BFU36_11685 [Sulfolobus sp. A20]
MNLNRGFLYFYSLYNNMATDLIYSSLVKVREGLLYAIITVFIGFIALIGFFANIVIGIILFIIALIIGILSLIRLYGGFSGLSSSVNNMGLGKIGAIFLAIPFLDILGIIFVGIAIYSIGDKFNNGNTKIGGILGAIPIGIVAFIGYILAYIGIGEILRSYTPASNVQPTMQGQQLQAMGNLKGNIANVTINSPFKARILDATLEEFQLHALNISPMELNSGTNFVTITFPPLPTGLKPGGYYKIKLTLDNNTIIYATLNYQP